MRHNQSLSLCRHFADSHCFRETTDSSYIRLGHIDESDVHEVREFVTGVLPLTGGDRHGSFIVQPSVAEQIINDLPGQ